MITALFDQIQHAAEAAPAAKDLLTPALTTLAVAITGAVTTKLNRRHGKRNDEHRQGEIATLERRIVEKLDKHQERTEEKIDDLRKTLTIRIDEVDACVSDAQRDATKALTVAIGVDGENGLRSDQRRLERRFDEMERERRTGLPDRRNSLQ